MTGGDSNAKRKAALESVRERQRRFKAIRHAKGLKRVTLWVPIEDVEELKLAAGDGPAFDRLRQAALAGLQAEISELLDEAAGGGTGKALPVRLSSALAAAVAARAEMDARLNDLMQALDEAVNEDAAARDEEGRK